jgi:hypothetical protein
VASVVTQPQPSCQFEKCTTAPNFLRTTLSNQMASGDGQQWARLESSGASLLKVLLVVSYRGWASSENFPQHECLSCDFQMLLDDWSETRECPSNYHNYMFNTTDINKVGRFHQQERNSPESQVHNDDHLLPIDIFFGDLIVSQGGLLDASGKPYSLAGKTFIAPIWIFRASNSRLIGEIVDLASRCLALTGGKIQRMPISL